MSDWDAARYHRISDPQFEWGQRVIARLRPADGERILDLGCGTGRLTQDLAGAVSGGLVVGLDRSTAMMGIASATTGPAGQPHPRYVQGDGAALPFCEAFDAIFSAATLHWIPDHDAVFSSVCTALRPRARFVAQCGGEGNLQRLLDRTRALIGVPPYEPYFRDWTDRWYFAGAARTAERLEQAGFVEVVTWVEDAPVVLPDAATHAEFISCVCIRHHLDRLPAELRARFVNHLTTAAADDSPPFTLDYRRLNLEGRRAA